MTKNWKTHDRRSFGIIYTRVEHKEGFVKAWEGKVLYVEEINHNNMTRWVNWNIYGQFY